MGNWRDRDIELSIQRKTLIALCATLLLHLLLVYVFTRSDSRTGDVAAAVSQAPLQLEMKLLDEPVAKPQPAQVDPIPQPQPKHAITPVPHKPREEKLPEVEPTITSTSPPPPPATKPLDLTPPPATDLNSYMQAMRERRQAAEQQASGYTPPAPTPEEQRMANIRRNLQQPGTNGIFQIVSKGTLSAQFMFRGWTGGNSSRARSEMFEVSVSPGGDIERAMIKRMIALIRTHYSGDFNWESQRLNRVIVLSARQEDNAGLEDFLLREFFG